MTDKRWGGIEKEFKKKFRGRLFLGTSGLWHKTEIFSFFKSKFSQLEKEIIGEIRDAIDVRKVILVLEKKEGREKITVDFGIAVLDDLIVILQKRLEKRNNKVKI